MKKLVALAAFLLLPLPSLAQEEAAQEEEIEEIRRYTVEVIIFAYTDNTHTGTEIFVPDAVETEASLPEDGEEPVFEDTTVIESETQTDVEEEEPAVADLELVMLEDDEFTLLDALERLERLDAYDPLMHFGWTQAAWAEELTLPLELSVFGEVPAGLEGNLTLYLSRYLHLVVNLALDAEPAADPQTARSETDFSFFDERASADDLYALETGPVRYRIEEDRIVKNGETRYFDHPKFGVIAKVTRVEEEEPVDEEFPESRELLGSLRQ